MGQNRASMEFEDNASFYSLQCSPEGMAKKNTSTAQNDMFVHANTANASPFRRFPRDLKGNERPRSSFATPRKDGSGDASYSEPLSNVTPPDPVGTSPNTPPGSGDHHTCHCAHTSVESEKMWKKLQLIMCIALLLTLFALLAHCYWISDIQTRMESVDGNLRIRTLREGKNNIRENAWFRKFKFSSPPEKTIEDSEESSSNISGLGASNRNGPTRKFLSFV